MHASSLQATCKGLCIAMWRGNLFEDIVRTYVITELPAENFVAIKLTFE